METAEEDGDNIEKKQLLGFKAWVVAAEERVVDVGGFFCFFGGA